MKAYRLHLGKLPLPDSDENEAFFVSSRTGQPLDIRQLFNWVKKVGADAADHFIENPNKYEKLKNLSPHWFRHLFASHLAKEGVPITVIKSLLRHGSIHTTQLYQHAEEEIKHQAIQKINIQSRQRKIDSEETPSIQKNKLDIYLRGGSISRILSLKKLILVLESQVFQGYTWHWKNGNIENFLSRMKKELLYTREVKICYELENVDPSTIESILLQIKIESDIRLFQSRIEVT